MTSFDFKSAAFYGGFVDTEYLLYGNAKANPNPPVTRECNFPENYHIVNYLTMRDFLFHVGDQPKISFGYIAEKTDGSEWVLAIRGTSNYLEWWGNLHFGKKPFIVPGTGNVAEGFLDIYETLAVEGLDGTTIADEAGGGGPTSFGAQVAQAVRSHAVRNGAPADETDEGGQAIPNLPPKLVVVGHSLGSALATLFVAENGLAGALHTPGLFAFASPLVGDAAFAATYARMSEATGINTFRIVNKSDIVTKIPPSEIGYVHVGTPETIDSHDWIFTAAHAHAMATYESLCNALQSGNPPEVISADRMDATGGGATDPKTAATLAASAAAAAGELPGGDGGPDQNIVAATTQLFVDPSFTGSPPIPFRLTTSFAPIVPADTALATTAWLDASATAMLTLTPLYFHAPAFFQRRDKSDAYVLFGIEQKKPQTPLTKQLRWSLFASLLTGQHQDIGDRFFSDLGDQLDAVANIPLPGGVCRLTMPLTAVVGGEPGKLFQIIDSTYAKLRKIADPSTQPLAAAFGIGAAQLLVADQWEAVFHQLIQASTEAAHLERTFDRSTVECTAHAASAVAGTANLPAGRSYMVLIPYASNVKDHINGQPDASADYQQKVLDAINSSQQFKLDPRGPIKTTSATNPFDAIPYITMQIDVTAA